MHKNLVIIPCGEKSKHQHWKKIHTNYNFDLCLINFSKIEYKDENSLSAKYNIFQKGMKWKLISDFFCTRTKALQYEYVLAMDDDIITEPDQIHKFFNICKKYNLDLSQPALDEKSFYSYESTLKKKAVLHTTSTVEIMMPCFSRRLLLETLEDFYHCTNGHGFGLEGVWIKKFHTENGKSKFGGLIGVVDCVDFGHFRKVRNKESNIYKLYGDPYVSMKNHEKRLGFKWCREGSDFKTYKLINNKLF
jgi:hypothetical protein